MKKIIRRITMLFCVMFLIIAASSTAYAASTPYVSFNDQGFTSIRYQPDPLYIAAGSGSSELKNIVNADGRWHVPAGNSINFTLFTNESNSTIRFLIFTDDSVFDIISESTTSGHTFVFNPKSYDTRYLFLAIPYSNVSLIGYSAYISDTVYPPDRVTQ